LSPVSTSEDPPHTSAIIHVYPRIRTPSAGTSSRRTRRRATSLAEEGRHALRCGARL
jgi:hypothetical protein